MGEAEKKNQAEGTAQTQPRAAQMAGWSPQEMEEALRLRTWKAVSWAVKGFGGQTLLPSDGPAPEPALGRSQFQDGLSPAVPTLDSPILDHTKESGS